MKKIITIALLCIVAFASCKKDDDEPSYGTVKGVITDAENASNLSGVLVSVYDPNTNTPKGITATSNSNGEYSIKIEVAGTYSLKLFKQGYESIPPAGMSAIVFTVELGKTISNDFEMYKSSVTNGGYISGKVSYNSSGISNTLVVASSGTIGFSAITDNDGNYTIFNVPAGSYTVKSWVSGYTSTEATATVTANTETKDVNLTLMQSTRYTVSGQISFLATGNIEVDVSLVHPVTKETIPGFSTKTVGGIYTISNVPNGTYIGRASFKNDTKVIDPDWIVKNGEPTVTVNGANAQRNFSVTGAVLLSSPTNDSISTEPIVVTTATPTFTWIAYSSTSDYIIEVSDASGKVIWGGFSNNWAQKNIAIPKNQLSIIYNSDGKASIPSLVSGKVYHWRIYSSKNDTNEPTGWKLISVSEDQMGLIKVEL